MAIQISGTTVIDNSRNINAGITTVSAGTAGVPSITPTGDTNTGIFFPAADTVAISEGGAEALRVDSSGRLLVGTSTAPTTVNGGMQFCVETTGSYTTALLVTNQNNSNSAYLALQKSRGSTAGSMTVVQNNDELGIIQFIGADGTNPKLGAQIGAFVDGTPGANDMPGRLVFSTTADGSASLTERMRITNNGSFSFNNASTPTARYYFNGESSSGTSLTNVTGAGHTGIHYVGMNVHNGGPGYNQPGRAIGIYGSAVGTAATEHSAIGVYGFANDPGGYSGAIGVYGSTVVSTYGSNGDGTGTVGVYGRRHGGGPSTGGGAGVLGRTGSSLYAENIAVKAQVDTEVSGHSAAIAILVKDENTGTRTAIRFDRTGGTVGSITFTASATAYNTSSDYRLKENIGNLNGALERLLELKVRRFNFISTPETTVDGFIAHEVKDIVPEAVTGEKDQVHEETYVIERAVPAVLDDDGNEIEPVKPPVLGTKTVPVYQGIDQSKLVPLLTAALQEAIAKIESLEARLTAAGI